MWFGSRSLLMYCNLRKSGVSCHCCLVYITKSRTGSTSRWMAQQFLPRDVEKCRSSLRNVPRSPRNARLFGQGWCCNAAAAFKWLNWIFFRFTPCPTTLFKTRPFNLLLRLSSRTREVGNREIALILFYLLLVTQIKKGPKDHVVPKLDY
jgi:hypothetical protein